MLIHVSQDLIVSQEACSLFILDVVHYLSEILNEYTYKMETGVRFLQLYYNLQSKLYSIRDSEFSDS